MSGKPVTIISCSRRHRLEFCETEGCLHEYTVLCDFPLRGRREGETCSRKLCGRCAVVVGPDAHNCSAHAKITLIQPEHEPSVA